MSVYPLPKIRTVHLVNEPEFVSAQVIEEGRAIGILVKERDGTVSAVRVDIDQIAD